MFTNRKREDINAFVCAVSLYVAETPEDDNFAYGLVKLDWKLLYDSGIYQITSRFKSIFYS